MSIHFPIFKEVLVIFKDFPIFVYILTTTKHAYFNYFTFEKNPMCKP